jgi:general secretion pathway protein G
LKRRSIRPAAGFSLIELLAAAAILAVMATVAVPVIETTVRREKERQLRQALRDIRGAIDAYKAAAASGHIALKPDDSGYPPALSDLATGVQDQAHKNGPPLYFLRRIPRDPFVSDLSIAPADTWGKRSFDSPPDAPREGVDVFDVYSNSPLTGLNGQPYREW